MTQSLGIAVIGTGAIAEAHLYAYQRASERARLLAVVDVDEARARRAAERFSVPSIHTDYREVLARDDIDAVSICAPPFLHVEISVAALKAAKHVLCEKPVAPTLAGLDAIDEAQRQSGCVFSGVFQLRFGRGARQVRRLLDEGRFGRLHLGIAETLWFRDHPYYSDVPWRGLWNTEAGGVTVSQAVHLIDLLVWFLGEPASVHAEAGTFRAPIEQEDTSVAVVRFRNGAIGQITCTVGAFGTERSRLEVYGTELTALSQGRAYDCTREPFLLASPRPEYAAALQAEMEQRVPQGAYLLHQGAIDDFLEAVQKGGRPLVGVEECRAALQVTSAIYESAMTGQTVELPITPEDPFYHHLPPEGFALRPLPRETS
jgi:predicted dehydrogenase